jgi:hypothetical protein
MVAMGAKWQEWVCEPGEVVSEWAIGEDIGVA